MMTPEERAIAHFKRAANALRKTLDAARIAWPDAEIYVGVRTLNLMSGQHHEGPGEQPMYERVMASEIIIGLDSGDW